MFVLLSKLTPFGNPLTVLPTANPLLSVASILIESIDVFTSFVWSTIVLTTGGVVSTTLIVNVVVVVLPFVSLEVTVIG